MIKKLKTIMNRLNTIILFFIISVFNSLHAEDDVTGLRMGAEKMEELIPMIQGKRVALVINQTSVIGEQNVLLLDTLVKQQIKVSKVFAPEHGLRGTADAGEFVRNSKDVQTGVPILSIYGKNKKPTKQQLDDVDIVIFDIQDVGVRFYTYISTLHYVMEACAENNKQLIVCDRPNPNDFVDGPVLQPEYKSFVGMHPIPVLHGLTVGELALMIQGEKWMKNPSLRCDLKILKMNGWKHQQKYTLPVKPSPNLPNIQSIRLYPSLCFFEATDISVGRGTIIPFQVVGAPEKKYGDFSFTPKSLEGWDKKPLHQDQVCYGIDLRDVQTDGGLTLQYLINFYKKSGKGSFFFTRPSWFNLLAGNKTLQQQINTGLDEGSIRKSWEKELLAYKNMRSQYLLYEEH